MTLAGLGALQRPWNVPVDAALEQGESELLRALEIKKAAEKTAAIEEIPHSYLVSIVTKGLWGVKEFLLLVGLRSELGVYFERSFSAAIFWGGEGVGGGSFLIRLNAGSFPVGLGDGVDGPGKRHANQEVGVNAMT